MWWDSIGGAFVGMTENALANKKIEVTNRLDKVNADASNAVRQAQNAFTAAKGSLARWTQSVNNNRRLTAGGKQLEAAVTNYRRERDDLGKQSFSQSIRMAEQQGASAAAQAAAGIDGGVVDMVNGATALRDSLVAENLKSYGELADYDAAKRAGAITLNTAQGLDNSLMLDMLDYNVDITNPQVGFSRTAAIMRGIASSQGVSPDASNKAADNSYKSNDAGTNARFSFSGMNANNETLSGDAHLNSNGYIGSGSDSSSSQQPYKLWDTGNLYSSNFGKQDENQSGSFWSF
jgi:hypothetical protein